MTVVNVSEMRGSHDAYRAALRAMTGDCAEARAYHVVTWYECQYIVYGEITLTDQSQRLPVIDITDLPGVALFQNTWPEQLHLTRTHAIVITPDEGHVSVLLENGHSQWVREAELPIRVARGTRDDYRNVDAQMMEELEESDGYGLSQA